MKSVLQAVIVLDVALVAALNAVAFGAVIYQRGLSEGLEMIQVWYSPFNIFTWIVNAALLSPAFFCAWLKQRI